MRRLFIHAGVHRTATTSIQAFLRANRDALLAAGYLNPGWVGRNAPLFGKIFAKSQSGAAIAAMLNRSADACGTDIHSIILSDEDICQQRTLTPLADLARHFDVRILLSLRRQDLWLESWHQQNVKWQWNPKLAHLTFAEFMTHRKDFHWIDYDRLTDRFAGQFGAGNLILSVFEKADMPDGPVATFARAIGLTDMAGFTMPDRKNGSLIPLCSELLRNLPLDRLEERYRAMVEQAVVDLNDRIAPATGASHLIMDHRTRSGVMADHARGNAKVARAFFGRDTLFRDPLPDPGLPLADQTLPQDSHALMRDLVGPMVLSLMARVGAMDKRPPAKAAKPRSPDHTPDIRS